MVVRLRGDEDDDVVVVGVLFGNSATFSSSVD